MRPCVAKNCDGQISGKAFFCPRCGAQQRPTPTAHPKVVIIPPIVPQQEPEGESGKKIGLSDVVLIVALLAFGLCAAAMLVLWLAGR